MASVHVVKWCDTPLFLQHFVQVVIFCFHFHIYFHFYQLCFSKKKWERPSHTTAPRTTTARFFATSLHHHFTASSIHHFTASPTPPFLPVCVLSRSVSAAACGVLDALYANDTLDVLDLRNNLLTDLIPFFLAMKSNRSLQALILERNPIQAPSFLW